MALNHTTALETCLRLMLRATPHPDDRDLWHDTIRQASILIDRQDTAPVKSFWHGAMTGLVLSLLFCLFALVAGFAFGMEAH